MASAAEGHEVVWVVGSAPVSRYDMVDFKESCSVAARGLASVVVAGQDFPSNFGRDGRRVSFSALANHRIALHPFGIRAAQISFA